MWHKCLSLEKNPSVKQGQRENTADKQRPYNVIHAVNTSQEGFDVSFRRQKQLGVIGRQLRSNGLWSS